MSTLQQLIGEAKALAGEDACAVLGHEWRSIGGRACPRTVEDGGRGNASQAVYVCARCPARAAIIRDAPSLDPIMVILRDVAPGQVQVVITCYGDAWTAYWGATGDRNALDMLRTCDLDYLSGRFWPQHERRTKRREEYLQRILMAVKQAIAQSEVS